MFDLNTRIEAWRRSLGDLTDEQCHELDDHLRTEIDTLRQRELSEAEAFVVATMRCGRPCDLVAEYSRADAAAAWSRRLRWMVAGFLVCTLVNLVLGSANVAFGVALIKADVSLPLTIALRIFFLTIFIAIVVAGWNAWLWRRPSLLDARPPLWLSTGWTLSVMIAVVPWLLAATNLSTITLYSGLSPRQIGAASLSSSVTGLVLPFTAPLILLIVAIGLPRRPRTATRLG
jgi:hypothetical protein